MLSCFCCHCDFTLQWLTGVAAIPESVAFSTERGVCVWLRVPESWEQCDLGKLPLLVFTPDELNWRGGGGGRQAELNELHPPSSCNLSGYANDNADSIQIYSSHRGPLVSVHVLHVLHASGLHFGNKIKGHLISFISPWIYKGMHAFLRSIFSRVVAGVNPCVTGRH